jgi:hypothetical protein
MHRCIHTLQSRGEEVDVGLLIGSNLLDVGIEWVVHACLDKVLLGIVLETLSVERGLEVLKGQSIVEDVG